MVRIATGVGDAERGGGAVMVGDATTVVRAVGVAVAATAVGVTRAEPPGADWQPSAIIANATIPNPAPRRTPSMRRA
jgi:hypothetical protein